MHHFGKEISENRSGALHHLCGHCCQNIDHHATFSLIFAAYQTVPHSLPSNSCILCYDPATLLTRRPGGHSSTLTTLAATSARIAAGIISVIYDGYCWVKWDNGAGACRRRGEGQHHLTRTMLRPI